MDKLAAEPRFSPLSGKLALGTFTDVPPALLADTALASEKERRVISEWAAARGECIKAERRYGSEVYRPPLQAFGIGAEDKVMAAAVALYDREISFGEFNLRRQTIAEELRANAGNLKQQIRAQQSAQEQADRQSREREQMQRDVEAALRQAAMARQEADRAQESASRLSSRANRPVDPPRRQTAPVAPYRNCFRFGNRVTCTNW